MTRGSRGRCAYVQLEAASFAKLWEVCRAEGLSVVADVHTHRAGPGQGRSDRTNPMMALWGHIALSVPRIATGNPRPRSPDLYVYEGNHRRAPYPLEARPHLILQDFDKAAKSHLSTCLLLWAVDLLKPTVRVVASRLEAAGFTTALVERRFGAAHQVMGDELTTALFGVDNVAARRDLDAAGFSLVVEAGLGSG